MRNRALGAATLLGIGVYWGVETNQRIAEYRAEALAAAQLSPREAAELQGTPVRGDEARAARAGDGHAVYFLRGGFLLRTLPDGRIEALDSQDHGLVALVSETSGVVARGRDGKVYRFAAHSKDGTHLGTGIRQIARFGSRLVAIATDGRLCVWTARTVRRTETNPALAVGGPPEVETTRTEARFEATGAGDVARVGGGVAELTNGRSVPLEDLLPR